MQTTKTHAVHGGTLRYLKHDSAVTGTPIRKIACMMRPLADADPVPLAVAILNAKSLTRSMSAFVGYTAAREGMDTGSPA